MIGELSALFNLSEDQLSKLRAYADILVRDGRKFGVTTIVDSKNIVIDHFWDSLILLRFVDNFTVERACILDVGTGGGFPGLPLKVAIPNMKLTLLEANFKKVIFLKRVVGLIGIEGVNIVWDRVERLPRDVRYDIILFRAVGDIHRVVRAAMSLLSSGGYMVIYAGEDVQFYMNRLHVLFSKGLRVLSVDSYMLPGKDKVRNLIFLGIQ